MREEEFAPEPESPLASVRAVFFDAGNTLVYLDLAWIAERLREDGFEVGEEALFRGQCLAAYEATHLALLKRYPTDSDRLVPYFTRVLELAGIPDDFTSDCVNVLVAEHTAEILWRSVPEFVPATLSELKRRGYMLGVISNSDGRLKSLLDRHNLTSFFTCIVDSGIVGFEKPGVEIFQCALETAETDPEKCTYVGDIYAIDMVGAHSAGIEGVLIDPLGRHGDFDCIRIERLDALLGLLPPVETPMAPPELP
ncbi:MAG: HAD family hydrolase [Planctomycetota bacterium]